ncbi:hypothetical protein DYBT9623_02931 [Dyadobacter sp. CECT 9623]|uniref:Lipoprotein n=1 Tax=Dyadobacter linearis TaxID=2823330 RepID=A0ABM8URV2_9BACT|nr:hypothetical protein [Dyadobacter sp. CECT 9623]CAG5070191.1 hypothetical protein DYBT9623_02931 [Dyadobacter sp. CECT 9623]
MKTSSILSLAFALALLFTSCGKKDNQAEEAESPTDALQAFADKAKEMGKRETVDPIDFRKLKELMPEELIGLKRIEATGEKSGAMGFTVSTAQARYKGDKDESIVIEIVDTGGIAGVSTMALATWSMAEIDKETADGYEKTTQLDGYKAFEKYNSTIKAGEINVLVADRYVVNVEGNNISVDQLKEALKDINLVKLEALK